MVINQCTGYPRGLEIFLGTYLSNKDITDFILAIPELKKVDIAAVSDTKGSTGYFHKLPAKNPEIKFGVCIEPDNTDHRLLDKYTDVMDVLVVDEITEYTVISNKHIYFNSGNREIMEVENGTNNRCTHDANIKECIEELFDVIELL